jgi:hypothetical protein
MRLFSCLVFGLTVLASSSAPAQTATAAPFKVGHHYFFIAPNGGLYVREEMRGTARPLLQANAFGTLAPSWDGKYIAYGMPAYNATSYDVLVLDVTTGRVFQEVLHNAIISRAPWTANNRGFFYTREDTAEHRERVYYHRVGQPQARDEIVYSRQDAPEWRYEARVSDDGQFAIFTISHPQDAHTRLYFIDLDDPGKPALNAPVVKMVDEFGAQYRFIDNGGNTFFLQTDDGASRGRIVLANTDVTRTSRWPVVWAETSDTLRLARTAGKEYVIAVYRNDAHASARVLSFPDPSRIRDELRRQADSARRSDGIRPRIGPPSGGGVLGPVRPTGTGTLIWHLESKREIPIPQNSMIVDMRSMADDDELCYTVKRADGTMESYVYNVKSGRNTLFDTNPASH